MLVVGGLLGLAPSTLHKVRRGCIIMAVVSLPWGGDHRLFTPLFNNYHVLRIPYIWAKLYTSFPFFFCI